MKNNNCVVVENKNTKKGSKYYTLLKKITFP
jgi:hypothetical protein